MSDTTSGTQTKIDPLLRLPKVRELVGGVVSSTIWRWIQLGNFPKPVRLGTNIVAWRTSDIQHWIESRPRTKRSPTMEESNNE